MNLTIRRPKREEIEAINELFAITITDNFKNEGLWDNMEEEAKEEIETLKQSLQRDFESEGKKEHHLIAIVNKQVVGTIAFGKPNAIILNNLAIDFSGVSEIKSVYILPRFQQQGIGSVLLKEILKVLQTQKIKAFCLDCGYKKSQGFWQKKLGDPIVVMKDYWSGGSDHLIWYLQLEKDATDF